MALSFVVLTGAGFSKGWGGFLVREMTFRIYSSRMLERPELRKALARTGNYEEVLALCKRAQRKEGRTAEYGRNLEQNLMDALMDAYMFQESILRFNSSHSPDLALLLGKVILPAIERGAFRWYTLNHDLMLEHKIGESQRIYCPGVAVPPRNTRQFTVITEFDPAEPLDPPTDVAYTIPYIKLHGSINWKNPETDLPVIVAGGGKIEQIETKPGNAGQMMKAYWESFKYGVGDGTTVLTIGYSFGDAHVNEVLAKPGVRIYNVDPGGFPNISGTPGVKRALAANILGVWPMTLLDLIGNHVLPKERHHSLLDDLVKIMDLA